MKRRWGAPTILDNSGVGDKRATGGLEGLGTRVLRHGLEARLGVRLKGSHPWATWLLEQAADALSKYETRVDGRTGYER